MLLLSLANVLHSQDKLSVPSQKLLRSTKKLKKRKRVERKHLLEKH